MSEFTIVGLVFIVVMGIWISAAFCRSYREFKK